MLWASPSPARGGHVCRICVPADGFGEAGDSLVGAGLDLGAGFEGLLHVEPAVFDQAEADLNIGFRES